MTEKEHSAEKRKRRPKRKPEARPAPGPESNLGDRFIWLLDSLWLGNRSAMARDLGFTHTNIVKIADRSIKPSGRVLTVLAEHPKINPAWLLTGQGQPLLSAETPAVDTAKIETLLEFIHRSLLSELSGLRGEVAALKRLIERRR